MSTRRILQSPMPVVSIDSVSIKPISNQMKKTIPQGSIKLLTFNNFFPKNYFHLNFKGDIAKIMFVETLFEGTTNGVATVVCSWLFNKMGVEQFSANICTYFITWYHHVIRWTVFHLWLLDDHTLESLATILHSLGCNSTVTLPFFGVWNNSLQFQKQKES